MEILDVVSQLVVHVNGKWPLATTGAVAGTRILGAAQAGARVWSKAQTVLPHARALVKHVPVLLPHIMPPLPTLPSITTVSLGVLALLCCWGLPPLLLGFLQICPCRALARPLLSQLCCSS